MTVPFSTYSDPPLVDIYGAVSISKDPITGSNGTLTVAGSAIFASALVNSGSVSALSGLTVSGGATVNSGLTVSGGATINSGATFVGGTGVQTDQIGGGQSATAVAIATSGTVSTLLRVSRINPGSAITSCVMGSGTFPGQTVTVVNEAAAASSLTFAASASSLVATGAAVIGGLISKTFVWDSATTLWY